MPATKSSAITLPRLAKANYGLDAPEVVRRFALLGAICLAFTLIAFAGAGKWLPLWPRYFIAPCLCIGCTFVGQAGIMIWASKSGKLRLRDKVLATIPWKGDERVLNVGCGHGLMLIGAAKRLKSGKAAGIDLWQAEDQAGNSREATWQNVLAEHVEAKVELHDGDARKLPFPENSFDVVVSSWALHNIYDSAGRDVAVREIVRVLKPAGHVILIDIRHTSEYAETLRLAGMTNVRRTGPNFLFVIPSFTLMAAKI